MADYLFLASRDPNESEDARRGFETAAGLAAEKHTVTVFLVQNAVFPARTSPRSRVLTDLRARGVEVLADEFSLRERGIHTHQLAEGVAAAPLDTVIDRLAAGHKTLFI